MKNIKDISVTAERSIAAKEYLATTREVLARLDHETIDRMTEAIWNGYKESRTLFIFGNGGSAALASHFACDIGKGTVSGREMRLKAISLVENVALITALANDSAYQEIFAEQLTDLAEKGDVAMAISGSGNSPNVIRGLEKARQIGLKTIVLTGFAGGKAKALADICLVAPSESMQHIEDAHLCASHAIFLEIRERIKRDDEIAQRDSAAAVASRNAASAKD